MHLNSLLLTGNSRFTYKKLWHKLQTFNTASRTLYKVDSILWISRIRGTPHALWGRSWARCESGVSVPAAGWVGRAQSRPEGERADGVGCGDRCGDLRFSFEEVDSQQRVLTESPALSFNRTKLTRARRTTWEGRGWKGRSKEQRQFRQQLKRLLSMNSRPSKILRAQASSSGW